MSDNDFTLDFDFEDEQAFSIEEPHRVEETAPAPMKLNLGGEEAPSFTPVEKPGLISPHRPEEASSEGVGREAFQKYVETISGGEISDFSEAESYNGVNDDTAVYDDEEAGADVLLEYDSHEDEGGSQEPDAPEHSVHVDDAGATHVKKSLFNKKNIVKKEENTVYEKYHGKTYVNGEDDLTKEVTERWQELRRTPDISELEQVRVLNLDIVTAAPKGYFNKYAEVVDLGVKECMRGITNNDLAAVIARANANPTDKEIQNETYLAISHFISEYIKGTEYRDAALHIIRNMIVNEVIGFDVLEPLWAAPQVTEIVCNGPYDIQIEIAGEMMKVPSLSFRNEEHMEKLLERMFSSVGKRLAQATPQVKGRLHDKSRIFATHRSISPEGPNLNIRRHPEGFWTPDALVERGAASEEVMAYIGNLIQKGASFIIAGGTSTGKAVLKSTKIQTPNGIVDMGDISTGDKVFDSAGTVCTVTNKFSNPKRQVYKVSFATGNSVYADAEHNWYVSSDMSRTFNTCRVTEQNEHGVHQGKAEITPERIAEVEKLRADGAYPEEVSMSELSKMVGFAFSPETDLMEKLLDSKAAVDKKVAQKRYKTAQALEVVLAHGKEILSNQTHKCPPLYSVMTTKEMIDAGVLLSEKRGRGSYNFRVPVLEKPVEYEGGKKSEDFKIPPYLLGLWLGHGDSRGNVVSAEKHDVDFYAKLLGDKGVEFIPQRKESTYSVRVNGVALATLLGEYSDLTQEALKHIPEEYLFSSVESRREILAGLVDSDGCVVKTAGWEFCTTNRQLIRDCVQVASSLGYVARVSDDRFKTHEDSGEKTEATTSSCAVTIVTADGLAKLPRKRAAHQEMFEEHPLDDCDSDSVAVTSIEEVPGMVEEMQCITVDSPLSTYMVTHHFTTTHNTSMLNALTGFYPPHARILTLEDNLEMKPNPKKYLAAALETRPPAADRENDRGVTMRDLVWGAMQMRPEVLIIGEVTDAAAYDLCQALNTGHAGASTFHANSSQLAITRVASLVAQSGLTTIDGAFDLISAAFDFVINLRHFPQDGSRKIFSIDEVGTDTDVVDGRPSLKTNQLWKFNHRGYDERGKVVGDWSQVGHMSAERSERRMFDSQPDMSWEELKELASLPEGYKTA